MLNFPEWPPSLQMAIVFVISLFVGGQINRGIYRLAFTRRSIDPWSAPPPKAKPRTWFDRLPVLGWFALQREEKLHGKRHWIRPALIELALAAGLTILFWNVVTGELIPFGAKTPALLNSHALYRLFLSHAILICLMTVATFIDFDEKMIPDAITAPGAMLGLVLAAAWPDARLVIPSAAPAGYDFLHIASPRGWPLWLSGWEGAVIGFACLWGWCFAMVPTLVTSRWGLFRGAQFYVASFFRGPYWQRLLLTGIIGTLVILAVWLWAGPRRWESLLTALVGLVAGGAIVWSVRIFASLALKQEAMGFGDVTLMAMIGAFLGWQAALLVFFLSPLCSVFVAIAQWATTGRKDIAFGPYLCLAAVFVIVGWPSLWPRVEPSLVVLGWIIPALFLACLALMCGMLMIWRIVRDALWSEE